MIWEEIKVKDHTEIKAGDRIAGLEVGYCYFTSGDLDRLGGKTIDTMIASGAKVERKRELNPSAFQGKTFKVIFCEIRP